MSAIIMGVAILLIALFGTKKVHEALSAAKGALHEHNAKRKGEKEAERLHKEQEEEVRTWQAYCETQAGNGSRGQAAGTSPLRDGFVVFADDLDDDDRDVEVTDMGIVKAEVIGAETVPGR